MKLTNDVINFTAGSADRQEGYRKFVEYFEAYKKGETSLNGVSFSEANDKMVDFYIEEIERMTGKKHNEFSDMAVFCGFTDVREAAFAVVNIMTDLVLPDSLIKDVGVYCDIKNGGWGDSLKIDLKPRDLFVVSKGGRAKRTFDIVRQYNGQKTLVPEPRVISVGLPLYDVLTKKYSLAEFVMKAVRSLETQMRYDIYDAFSAAMEALGDSGDTALKVTGYAQDSAVALAQKVQAWNGGKPAVFLGTKLALSKILPASTNYRYMLGDEYVKLGHVRDFFGFNAMEMEQLADWRTEFKTYLRDDRLYIVSPTADKIVKVFTEGATLTNNMNHYDSANLMANADLVKSYGVGVATSAIGGVITLS